MYYVIEKLSSHWDSYQRSHFTGVCGDLTRAYTLDIIRFSFKLFPPLIGPQLFIN